MIIGVSVNDDDFYNEGPDVAVLNFTLEGIKRVQKLIRVQKELGVINIADSFDIAWKTCNVDIEDAALKDLEDFEGMEPGGDLIKISDAPYLKGYLKDRDVSVTSVFIGLDILDELEKVLECPEKNLPLLLGDLKTTEAVEELQRRLKK